MKHDHKFGSQDAKDTVLHGRLIDDIDVSATHFLKETKAGSSQISNKKRLRRMIGMALLLCDALAITAAFLFSDLIRHGAEAPERALTLLAVILPIYCAIAISKDGYSAQATIDPVYGIRKAVLAFLFAVGSVLLFAYALKASDEFSRIMLGLGAVFGLVALFVSRQILTRFGLYKLGDNPYATLIIDESDPASLAYCSTESSSPDPSDHEALLRLGQVAEDMERVIVKCAPENRAQWAFVLKSLNIHGEIVVDELAELAPLALTRHKDRPALLLSCDPLSLRQRLSKRFLDLFIVLMVLPVAFPIIVLAAIAVKLESHGPAFFGQERIGLANRNFRIWKLRSMLLNVGGQNGDRSTSRDDERLTRVGRFIRSTSIDELPQLFNVLMGDMSIVGPRPHAAGSRAEDRLFWDIDGRYWHRNAVKPGLTGLAQIRGYRGTTHQKDDLRNRLQADLEYLSDWSFLKDLRIILKTFTVLVHKNAY